VRRRGLGTVLVGFGTTLAMILFNSTGSLGGRFWYWAFQPIERWTHNGQHAWPVQLALWVFHDFAHYLMECLVPGLAAASIAMLASVVARAFAGARQRAGRPDPLERLRKRPRLALMLTLLPVALFASPFALSAFALFSDPARDYGGFAGWLIRWIGTVIAGGIVGGLAYGASRAGMRGLLAPLETREVAPREPGDIVFSAIAVTARTRGAVAALAALTFAMVAWAAVAPSHEAFPWALAAYVAAAMTAPFALRRVSRIAVGIDGVWVRDTSQALFYAYRDLEGARARGADLELVAKGGRAALRLQMHGDDAGRRDEVLALVQDAIARSRTSDTRGAEMLVKAMPARQIVASAAGDVRYRMPSISRQQLWDLVESSATDGSTRTAAAEALAIQIDETDRARLRVAAEQCAEPRVRVALAALAGEEAAAEAAAEQDAAAQR
jgi:hypothetical protein